MLFSKNDERRTEVGASERFLKSRIEEGRREDNWAMEQNKEGAVGLSGIEGI